MPSSYDNSVAVVVLPAAGAGRLSDAKLRRWLARADLVRLPLARTLLPTVLAEIGRPVPPAGLAALRLWGQTGERPTAWIAAADPVFLEPRLDRLCLHDATDAVDAAGLRRLTDHLQATLGENGACGFASVNSCVYVTAGAPLAAADVPAAALDGQCPDDWLPAGEGSAGYRRLISEIEMSLHDYGATAAGPAAGSMPVNGLWLWGGGTAEPQRTEPLPPLFGNDPLLQGYWFSNSAVAEPWPGSIAGCLAQSAAGFVALAPAVDDAVLLASLLAELREALAARRVSRLVLWFRDDLRAEIRHAHRLRVWRLRNTLLERGLDRATGSRA